MALGAIWDADPDAKPKQRAARVDDVMGVWSIGKMGENGDPMSLMTLRFVTGDPKTADAIAELYGGTVVELPNGGDNFLEVVTDAKSIEGIMTFAQWTSDMKWFANNKLVHHCDGTHFLSPEDKKGQECGCPKYVAERKALSRDRIGPSPAFELFFRLADDPDLGVMKFKTGSWKLVDVEHEHLAALKRIDGEALVRFENEYVEYTPKKGPRAGTLVSFNTPKIKVLKPYQDAIADEPSY
ncbi:recombination directionality factor [Streptomyces malaysiensis]